jgi:hypothetical protein
MNILNIFSRGRNWFGSIILFLIPLFMFSCKGDDDVLSSLVGRTYSAVIHSSTNLGETISICKVWTFESDSTFEETTKKISADSVIVSNPINGTYKLSYPKLEVSINYGTSKRIYDCNFSGVNTIIGSYYDSSNNEVTYDFYKK